MNSEDVIVENLASQGWYVVPDFLSASETAALRGECLQAHAAGAFHAAAVGRGETAGVRSEVRGDQILWMDDGNAGPALRVVFDRYEALRQGVNQALFLGLFELEAHFAVYPPGGGYQRHLDRFRDDDHRSLTVVLYLNDDWHAEDGGLLRFWPEADGQPIDILPAGGTLVTFLSDRYWHEVLPAQRQRLSLTGWFRRR